GPNSAAPKIINPAHKPANQQRRSPVPTPKAESLRAIGGVLGIPAIDLFTIVGWIAAGELPSIGPYLRARYPKLPEDVLREIETHFDAVVHEYDPSFDLAQGA
ncbi:hypothetical protein OQ854_24880, partial [Mycobacterium ulcerans]|nr:hypothetical protein [Mycobacterium ulcerans]